MQGPALQKVSTCFFHRHSQPSQPGWLENRGTLTVGVEDWGPWLFFSFLVMRRENGNNVFVVILLFSCSLFLLLLLLLLLLLSSLSLSLLLFFWRWQRSNMFLRRESLGSIPHPRFQPPPGLWHVWFRRESQLVCLWKLVTSWQALQEKIEKKSLA